MSLDSILRRLQLRRPSRRAKHHYAVRRPRFETFDDWRMLAFTPTVSFPVGASPMTMVTAISTWPRSIRSPRLNTRW